MSSGTECHFYPVRDRAGESRQTLCHPTCAIELARIIRERSTAIDFAAGEKLVGIEALGASRLFEKPESPVIELKDLILKVITA